MTDLVTGPALATAPAFLADPRVQRAIQLVWHEAALLDAKDYEAWAELYTDDALYVVPIERDTDDFARLAEHDLRRQADAADARRPDRRGLLALRRRRRPDRAHRLPVHRHRPSPTPRSGCARRRCSCRSSATSTPSWVPSSTTSSSSPTSGDRIGGKVIRLLNSDASVNASGYLL